MLFERKKVYKMRKRRKKNKAEWRTKDRNIDKTYLENENNIILRVDLRSRREKGSKGNMGEEEKGEREQNTELEEEPK